MLPFSPNYNYLIGDSRTLRRCEWVYLHLHTFILTISPLKFKFEDLIRRVSNDFTLVVPVISFKELPLADWKSLPDIISKGAGRPPPFVLCTHYDLVLNLSLMFDTLLMQRAYR